MQLEHLAVRQRRGLLRAHAARRRASKEDIVAEAACIEEANIDATRAAIGVIAIASTSNGLHNTLALPTLFGSSSLLEVVYHSIAYPFSSFFLFLYLLLIGAIPSSM